MQHKPCHRRCFFLASSSARDRRSDPFLLRPMSQNYSALFNADEESFHAMRLPEEGDDFEYRQMVNAETAKLMIAHGLQLGVQVLNAKQYFEWLGARQNTYQAQHEYPGGRHVSGVEANIKALVGIK